MKKYGLLFTTAALWLGVAATAFTSCSEDIAKEDYDYRPNSALTLSTLQLDSVVKASDEAVRLKATVTDAGQSEIYDMGFIYATDESFAAYETLPVAPDTLETGGYLLAEELKIPQGKTFYFKAFVLTKDGMAVSAEAKSISLPVTWVDVGTVEFEDLFYTGEKADITIQKFEGQNRYRLVEVYSEIFALDPEYPEYPDIEKCRGKYLEFYLDEEGNADKLPTGFQDLGLGIYGYEFYWDPSDADYGEYCTFTNNANQYTITGVVTEYGDVAYTFEFKFTWFDGYPGEIPEPKLSDFNSLAYEEVAGAVREFTSSAYYNESWPQALQEAVDVDPENAESQYKNLYYLPDLYYEGYGLAFYYDGEKITIPANQPTGTSFKKPLYVSQSSAIPSGVETTAKGIKIYTLGLKFHHEGGTVVGEFAETFYYSEDLVSYAIADYHGSYTLTGASLLGYPDAEMSVTITSGAEENTLLIRGIDYADSVKATFDPATSFLSIAPQVLPNFVYEDRNGQEQELDITLLTYVDTENEDEQISDTASLDFTFTMSGLLVLAPASEAVGYLLYSAAAGYMDGYVDLSLTPAPQAALKVAPKAAAKAVQQSGVASRPPVAKALSKAAVVKKQKCSQNNFAVQSKASAKVKQKRAAGQPLIF